MFKLTADEIMAETYAVLRLNPHGNDLNVAKECACAIVAAEVKKEIGRKLGD